MRDDDFDRPPHTLPALDIGTGFNHSPHVVILGAGASRACCPKGDRDGNTIPVMADFAQTLGLEGLLAGSPYDPTENFEVLYSRLHRDGRTELMDSIDVAVRSYFGNLNLPDIATIYDYLVLSLREKDVIVTFNWDPLLVQAYRRWRHLGVMLPQLVFLHGNIALGVDREKSIAGFIDDDEFPDRKLSATQLLYPVTNKNYIDDRFTAHQWEMTKHFLSKAYLVTIFGYSAPVTDVEARSMMLEAWRSNRTRVLAEFDIIDIRDREAVRASWSDFIVRSHGGVWDDFRTTNLWRHPRRTCEAFAFATLQQDPWHEDPFPAISSLADLEAWVRPLIAEEKSGKLAGRPLH